MTANDNVSAQKTNSDVEPAPLSIEQLLVSIDGAALREFCRSDPKQLEQGLSAVRQAVEKHCKRGEFEKLCNAGCDQELLLWLLHWFSSKPVFPFLKGVFYTAGPRNAGALFKRTSTKVMNLLKRVERISWEIQSLNLNFEYCYLLPIAFKRFWELPETMRDYAKFIQSALRHFGSGTQAVLNLRKAMLTHYVKTCTGKFHDVEVSALMAAMTDASYDETGHRSWRQKHFQRYVSLWNRAIKE